MSDKASTQKHPALGHFFHDAPQTMRPRNEQPDLKLYLRKPPVFVRDQGAMNIDEFFQIYQDIKHSPIKLSLDKLARKKHKELEQMNQPVHIQDMVLRPPHAQSYGESNAHIDDLRKKSTQARLKDHIAMMFNLANEEHRANNCELGSDGHYQIKTGKENHVTRLSMPEFSLYTKKPMTMAEYTELYQAMHNSVFPLDPNVHVLLSSFAVLDDQGQLLNMSMFVEGGNPPNAHSFAKNNASFVDVDYGDKQQLFSQQHLVTQENYNRTMPPTDAIISEAGDSIYTGSVVELRTVGGACYTQTIDVCLDHSLGHSKRQMERRVLGNARLDDVIPEQIEQCVTSNFVHIQQYSIISDHVLHADPVLSMLDDHSELSGTHAGYNYRAAQGIHAMDTDAIQRVIPAEYSTTLSKNERGYCVLDPPFGSGYTVELMAERPAAKHLFKLQESVKTHNAQAIERKLMATQQREFSPDEQTVQSVILAGKIKDHLSHRLSELEHRLLKHCEPTTFERLFKPEEFKQKLEARNIITNRLRFMNEAVEKHGDDGLLLLRSWKKDLEIRLQHVGSCKSNNTFTKQLSDEIKQSLDMNLSADLSCSVDSSEAVRQDSPSMGSG